MVSNGAVQGALAMWIRCEWRRRSRAIIALTLIVGVAGGVVLTTVAGARRTATSLERFASESRGADVMVDVGAVDREISEEISRLPMVHVSGQFTIVFALVEGIETDLAIWAPRDARIGAQIESDRVLRGRRPDPASLTEVAVNETTAEIVGVDVGDEVSIATMTPEQVRNEEYFPPLGPRLELQVVGVVRSLDDLASSSEGGFIASRAFLDTVHGKVDEWTTVLAVGLTEGATADDFEAAVGALVPPGQEYETLSYDVRSKAARGTISLIASGLAVFALVAAVASVVAIGQAVGRHLVSARDDEVVLGQLGVTQTGRRFALVLLTLPIAIGGAALAVVVAWFASPIMPVGLARRADPDPGYSADWSVFAVGGMAVAVVVVGSATLTATWLTRTRRMARTQPGPSAVASAISRSGVGSVAVIGVHLALDRRAPTLPVRSAIAGVAVAISGIVAVFTFSASLDRLTATPARWGYGWDLLLNFNSSDIGAAAERIVDDDRLTAVARWDAGFSYVEGEGVAAFGLAPLEGDIGFSLRSGRQPVAPGEVVLGPDTAERLGVQLGDPIRVAPESNDADPASVIVVGTALFPDDQGGSFADAVGYFGAAFAQRAIVPDLFEASQLVVRVTPGLDVDAVAISLDEEYPGSALSGENLPVPPGEVANLSNIRRLPRWLACFVAMLGLASLGHVLITTIWRRRAELATLRSLGLTSRQTVLCIVCQAMTIILVGLGIGIPLGIAAGNAAWFGVADPIGIATDATRSLLALGVVTLAALVVAALVALLPGWRATRLRPAEALRME